MSIEEPMIMQARPVALEPPNLAALITEAAGDG